MQETTSGSYLSVSVALSPDAPGGIVTWAGKPLKKERAELQQGPDGKIRLVEEWVLER